jgi:hypothetical protein
MTIEEGESSTKVIILRIEEKIKATKDNNRDIKITLNNNIIIKQPIKVALLLKFLGDLEKLEEYLNKT